MSLRTRTLLTISAVVAALFAGLILLAWQIVLRGFDQEEARQAGENAARVLNALDRERRDLLAQVKDYAEWDDSYRYISDRNPEFVNNNLMDDTFTNLEVSLIAFVGAGGDIALGKWFGPDEGVSQPLTPAMERALTDPALLLGPGLEDEDHSGLLELDGVMALVAVTPILTSDSTGPSRGSLIFGRFLYHTVIERLSEFTQLQVSLAPLPRNGPDGAATGGVQQPGPCETSKTYWRTGETVTSCRIVSDVWGSPALLAEATSHRSVYNRGLITVQIFIASLAALGVVFVAASMLLLERTVLARVGRLSQSVRGIRDTVQLQARVSVSGRDEITRLGEDINEMLASLEQSGATRRSLSWKLASAQEDERRRIAVELHDEIGQALTGLKLMLESGDNSAERVRAAQQVVKDLMEQTRDLALNLRPSVLDDFGLVPALKWQIERFSGQSGVQVEFQTSGDIRRLPAEVETAAFRIVQECLTNIAKHSHARTAKVRVELAGGMLRAEVADTGVGFLPEGEAGRQHAIGLAGMRERADAVGGVLLLHSEPGQGTRLVAEIPIDGHRPTPDRAHNGRAG
jgi:signal transduction histidine kinase